MLKTLLGPKLEIDARTAWVTIISTLILIVDRYHQFTPHKYLDRPILYLLLPLAVILLGNRENPREFGFSFGDWKLGLVLTLLGVCIMAPVIYFLGRSDPSMRSYYLPFTNGLPWTTFLDLIGWEFFFRGWILFSYARRYGADALWLQAVPFALAHLGKPEIETLSTIFGGFAFGWVAWRTKSFVWPFLIHWFIATFIIIVAAGFLG